MGNRYHFGITGVSSTTRPCWSRTTQIGRPNPSKRISLVISQLQVVSIPNQNPVQSQGREAQVEIRNGFGIGFGPEPEAGSGSGSGSGLGLESPKTPVDFKHPPGFQNFFSAKKSPNSAHADSFFGSRAYNMCAPARLHACAPAHPRLSNTYTREARTRCAPIAGGAFAHAGQAQCAAFRA